MALYSPNQFYPCSLMGTNVVGTIDGTKSNTFRCVIQGDNCKYYHMYIYKLSDSTTVYDTNIVTLSNALNNNDTLEMIVPAGTLVNGTIYKWKVDVSTDNSTWIEQPYEIQFYANTNPTITIDSFNSTVNTYSKTFTATYSQSENINIDWYEWLLYDSINVNPIETSGKIESTKIQYTFSDFVNNESYYVQVIGQTVNGIQCESNKVPFTIAYNSGLTLIQPNCSINYDRDSVNISYPMLKQIKYSSLNGIDTVNDFQNFNVLKGYKSSLILDSDTDEIDYKNNVNINSDFTIIQRVKIINNSSGIIEFGNQSTNTKRQVYYSLGYLYYNSIDSNNNVTQIQKKNVILPNNRSVIFGIRSDDVYVRIEGIDINCGTDSISDLPDNPSDYDYRYEINCGTDSISDLPDQINNLFDPSAKPSVLNFAAISDYDIQARKITVSSTVSHTWSFAQYTVSGLSPDTKYRLSLTISNNDNLYCIVNDSNETWICEGNATFTAPADGIVLIKFFATRDVASIDSVTFSNIQLERGTNATPFEPYNPSDYDYRFEIYCQDINNINLMGGNSSNFANAITLSGGDSTNFANSEILNGGASDEF